jgi:N-acetyl-anhydromuramyl-L-alanine amidase AmpD
MIFNLLLMACIVTICIMHDRIRELTCMIDTIWMPSPFRWTGRQGHKPRYVIIHGTAGGSSAEGVASWFQNAQAQVSAHYIVGRDGIIIQCVREEDAAWSNGYLSTGHEGFWQSDVNPNFLTISIEIVKPSNDNSDLLTAPQQASCFALIKDICERNDIPKRKADANGGITGHYSLDPVNRSRCPGTFDWPSLWTYLNEDEGGSPMNVPKGWHDDGVTLRASNGVPITLGFREWILHREWHHDNVPQAPAIGLNPVEISNPGLGGGTVQAFRHTILAWTQTRGVYELWVGQEWLALRRTVEMNTSNEVANLKAKLAEIHKISSL